MWARWQTNCFWSIGRLFTVRRPASVTSLRMILHVRNQSLVSESCLSCHKMQDLHISWTQPAKHATTPSPDCLVRELLNRWLELPNTNVLLNSLRNGTRFRSGNLLRCSFFQVFDRNLKWDKRKHSSIYKHLTNSIQNASVAVCVRLISSFVCIHSIQCVMQKYSDSNSHKQIHWFFFLSIDYRFADPAQTQLNMPKMIVPPHLVFVMTLKSNQMFILSLFPKKNRPPIKMLFRFQIDS